MKLYYRFIPLYSLFEDPIKIYKRLRRSLDPKWLNMESVTAQSKAMHLIPPVPFTMVQRWVDVGDAGLTFNQWHVLQGDCVHHLSYVSYERYWFNKTITPRLCLIICDVIDIRWLIWRNLHRIRWVAFFRALVQLDFGPTCTLSTPGDFCGPYIFFNLIMYQVTFRWSAGFTYGHMGSSKYGTLDP